MTTTPRPPTFKDASALAAQMHTEVGTWANLWFGPTSVGFYRTSLALKLGQALQALDDAIAELRRRYPHPQRIVTIPHTLDETLDRLATLLSTWDTATTRDGVVLFDGSTHEHLAVRPSGTEPGTRLYIEAPTSHHGPSHRSVQCV
ncbi:MAG: hypothetical protein ACRDUV_19170 [Pseudonocardiaceae bacterium]